MTVNRIIYLIVTIILIVFFILYVDRLALILLLFVIFLPIISLINSVLASKYVNLKFKSTKSSISKGTPINLSVNVKNNSYIPIPNMVIFFEYSNSLDGKVHKMSITVPAPAKSDNTISFEINSAYCGIVSVKMFYTKIYDNLKLFTIKKRYQQENSILIMPEFHDIPMIVENVTQEVSESDTFSKYKAGDDCSEVFDIREYQDGDRLNRIHWKLSSKGNQTYVKEYSLPISNSVVIIPEVVNSPNSKLISDMDTITELLLSISEKLNYNEVSHQIAIYSNNSILCETITNDEETYNIVGNMVRTGIQDIPKPCAFHYFQANNEYNSYSHIIYITNVLDVGTLSCLEDFSSTKKTVLYVSTQPIDSKYLNYDGVQIVQVVNGKILESIGEFIV